MKILNMIYGRFFQLTGFLGCELNLISLVTNSSRYPIKLCYEFGRHNKSTSLPSLT